MPYLLYSFRHELYLLLNFMDSKITTALRQQGIHNEFFT